MKQIFFYLAILFIVFGTSPKNLYSENNTYTDSVFSLKNTQVNQIINLGSLVTSIGRSTQEFGAILEEGEIEKAKRSIKKIDKEIDIFSHELKQIIDPSYHNWINSNSSTLHEKIQSINYSLTQNDLDKAKEEYLLLNQNWENLVTYFEQRVNTALEDKKEVKGWLHWAIDLAIDWWDSRAE